MKRIKFLLLATICTFLLAPFAGATALTYTDNGIVPLPDPPRWLGNLVTYTLDFVPAGVLTYNATLSIASTANTSPEWYAGWFAFKFSNGSDPSDISNLVGPGITGLWSVSDVDTNQTVEVLAGGGNYKTLTGGGYVGFYLASLTNSPPTDDPTQGILLTGDPGTSQFTFQFTIPEGSEVNLESMNFKVGYFDGKQGNKFKYNGLSVDLVGPPAAVPEPATMFLLGSGLIGLAGFVRRKFRK